MTEKHPVQDALCLSKLSMIHDKVSELSALINNHVRFELIFKNYGQIDHEGSEPNKTHIEFKLHISGGRESRPLGSAHDNLVAVLEQLNIYISL